MNKVAPFFWSFVNTGGSQIIAFAASMAIARITGPEVFGAFAIASAMILMGNIFAEAGFSSTIIYDSEFCEEKASTILWMSFIASVLVFIFLIALAKPLSSYFVTPSLQYVIPFMAISCIATSLGNPHAALIARELRFKKKAVLSLSANIIGVVVGLTIAFMGYPLAGLTAIFVLTPVLLTLFMWIFAPWSVKLTIKPRLLLGDLTYASNLALSSFLEQIGKSGVVFFLGHRFDIVTVGYYSRAEAIKNIASQAIDKVVQRVAFPVLSRARETNEDSIINNHLSMSQALVFILFPLGWFIQKFADDILLILFGPGWADSASLLRITILGGIVLPLVSLNLTLLKSVGRSIFMLLNKLTGVCLIFGLFLLNSSNDISVVLSFLVSVFILQLVGSIISLAWMPEFLFVDYLVSMLSIVCAIIVAIAVYEYWAAFAFDHLLANLLLHAGAIFITSALMCFLARRLLLRTRESS
jgi:O-antigen/teichoic acid export membrane protein